jgi:predicted nucleotidyltransferase
METIFKEGNKRIMKIFYLEKNKSFHLREIARKSQLNENSVSRFIKGLETEKILFSFKEGNLKMFGLCKNQKTFCFLTFFDIEKYLTLPEIRKRAISFFLNSIQEKPVIVLLFGSSAKGNFRNDSDIDLLLVVNRKTNLKKDLDYSESQTGIKINALQMEYLVFLEEVVSKKDKLVASAISSGYPITNHIKYYEEVMK